MEITVDIDIDEIAEQVADKIDLDDIADRVKDNIDIEQIIDEIASSYQFETAIENAAITAVENALADQEDDRLALAALVERVATLEAALATAGYMLTNPAKRVLHGVKVPVTTTDLF